MPVKVKAKEHSNWMKTTTHHNLTHVKKPHKPTNYYQKLLAFVGILFAIAFICIAMYTVLQ